MATGSQSDFAKARGVNKSTVSRWAKAGHLVTDEDGLVDFEASAARIESARDPQKQGVVQMHARARTERVIDGAVFAQVEMAMPETPGAAAEPPAAATSSPGEPPAADSTYAAFNRARAAKEEELALLAKMKREEQMGLLIRRDEVQREVERLAAIVAKGLAGIPARAMPLINGEPDAGKRDAILEMELRQVATDFADAADAMQLDGQGGA